jgi:membrane protease YdiL (CAAX protease family)
VLTAIAAAATAYLALWIIGDLFGVGGELRLFAVSGLESLPFLPLCVLAYTARRAEWARAVTCGYWFVLVGGAALMAWLATLETLPSADGIRSLKSGGGVLNGGQLFRAGSLLIAPLSLYGVGAGVLIGLAGFHPSVRRMAARVLPIDADSFVDATALATVLGLTVIAFVPLLVLGEPPLLLLSSVTEEIKNSDGGEGAELRSTVYGFLWLVPSTIVAVGYPLRRSFPEALQRLGFVKPKFWQAALGVVLVPVVVGTMSVVDHWTEAVWTRFDWPTTDSKTFDQMMRFAINPWGAVVVGITAGVGEELAVRGVLQPRLGIVLSNLFFTSLHALQYNWDGLVSVFLIGLALGVIRKYTNTTTSAMVHGGYDFVLVMAEVLHAGLGHT